MVSLFDNRLLSRTNIESDVGMIWPFGIPDRYWPRISTRYWMMAGMISERSKISIWALGKQARFADFFILFCIPCKKIVKFNKQHITLLLRLYHTHPLGIGNHRCAPHSTNLRKQELKPRIFYRVATPINWSFTS